MGSGSWHIKSFLCKIQNSFLAGIYFFAQKEALMGIYFPGCGESAFFLIDSTISPEIAIESRSLSVYFCSVVSGWLGERLK